MEGTSYSQTTFGNMTNTLEKIEQSAPATEAVAETTDTTEQTAAAQENTQTQTEGTATTETVETQQEDTSSFEIPFEDETTSSTADTKENTPTYNWKDEIKKVNKKDVLKELGLNDFAIEIDEHLAMGGKADDFLNAKAIDYNKVSDSDILKSDLRKLYPNLSADQIDLMYSDMYEADEDASDREKQLKQLKSQAESYKIRQSLISEQQKFKIPDTPILQKDEAYEQWKQQQDSHPKLMEQLRNFYETHPATKNLYESKRVTINLGEGVAPFNFNVDKPQMLTKAVTDGGATYNKLMTTQSGEPDVAKQQLVSLFMFNPEKFIQDIFKYGQRMGVRKELVEDGQNAQRPKAIVANMTNPGAQGVSVKKFGDIGR